ncbi:GcvT family protein [Paraburkholderia caledonica]|uniref:4-methylaminobutanoate oxidase (Formaldehyde-forming) n=1 Tax=Paraburkholderia caledonica TaxID=134536 RepID=A0ABU1L7D2_9BURK|nr:FAD-dependent oxidoreductase [Paraburkholderia caledonica]MDR6379120.1 4-methylaminobutanoate oxidase (formaldehyde-forming) [Paraburkholderia caledonica]
MSTSIPQHARVVIIGGGIIGCSVAYHLTKLGWTDVVLMEQGQLSCGTTWHAAGLVGQLRAQESMTKLIRYSTALYAELEAETGLATGWKQCGSLSVARTAERMTQLKRTAAVARAYGVACDVIGAREAGDLWPVMRTDDLLGAVWLPGDGKANPTDLTQALARGARMRGARIAENTRVTAIHTRDAHGAREATGVAWRNKNGDEGTIGAEIVVNCAGQWAKAVGRLCDVTVPLHSAEHYYIVTERIAGVHPDLPVMRDPDGFIYFKEEVGGLVMGGFEPNAKPWGMQGIPEHFEFQLLPDDWDQFEILMTNALQRVPALETAQVRQFYNGPESFTPDNNFMLGEAPELRRFFVGAGFNSMGIASAGGAGMALAEWIVAGEPTMDLWPVDIRRFARFNGNDTWLHDRVKETLGLHYAMPWPNRELDSARPFRRSPLYALLREDGACFGSKMGWERANFFAPTRDEARIDYAFGQQNWLPLSGAEHRACRERVALFDMTSFSKFLVKGRDAQSVLQNLVANDVDVPRGTTVYTGMLNERGNYESDFTLTRLAADQYLLVTGTAQTTRDFDMIDKAIPRDKHCVLVDVTSQYAVLAVMGPRSRELLQSVSKADWRNESFAFGQSREVDIGYATVRATRLTYVGELGWELYVPVEFAVGVYEILHEAGKAFGLVNAGYYAIDSLRIEKGYRAWGRELTPDTNPFEAGLAFACKLDTDIPFRGRDALLELRGKPLRRRMVVLTADGAADRMLWGGEAILRDGKPVGFVSSAAFGHTLGCPVAMGYVNNSDGAADSAYLTSGAYAIDVAGELLPATLHLKAPYDPRSERIRN